jgi:molybdenum cofactor synthesis domain-containing protein
LSGDRKTLPFHESPLERRDATPTAALVVIGDEILSGKTDDTNTPFLLSELRALGVAVRRVTIVPDDVDTIASELRRVAPTVDHVLTTGGVGPTHDDVTIEAVARAFDRPVVRSTEIVAAMEMLWKPVRAPHLRMADIPEGSELVYGEGVRFPLVRVENVYLFPGVPEILRQKFGAIRERFRAAPFQLARVYCTCGEGTLAPHMTDVVRAFPQVAVGSYPTLSKPDYRVLVTFESKDRRAVHDAVERFRALVEESAIAKVDLPL